MATTVGGSDRTSLYLCPAELHQLQLTTWQPVAMRDTVRVPASTILTDAEDLYGSSLYCGGK